MTEKDNINKDSRAMITYDAVAELEGIDAESFLEYIDRDLTQEETHSLQEAHDLYKRHSKP